MTYQNIKQQYKQYKNFVEQNESKYQLADKIVSEGILESLGLSVGVMDKVYHEALVFYTNYELAKTLIEQLEDMGVHLIANTTYEKSN